MRTGERVRSPGLRRVSAAVVAAAILAASLLPDPPGLDQPGSDKAAHLAAYAVLGFAVHLCAGRRSLRSLLASIAVCTAYGGLIEMVQPLAGRARELADLVVDLAGSAVGAAAAALPFRRSART
jgi:VanZ family protein